MTTARQRQREAKRLASDLKFEATLCVGPDTGRLAELLGGMPRDKALAAIETAIADCNDTIAFNERWANQYRAAVAVLEGLRPGVGRPPLRVVK